MPEDAAIVERMLNATGAQAAAKRAAWQAYFSAGTPAEFQAGFDRLDLPKETKPALFDLRFNGISPGGTKPSTTTGKAATTESGWLQRPLMDIEPLAPLPGAGETPYGKFRGGMVRGIARGVSSLTTPENVGLLGTMRAAPKVLGAAAGGAAATAAGLYFSAQMALNLIRSIPAAKEAWEKGDYTGLGGIVGEDVVAAALLGHGGRETRRAGKPALEEVPKAPRPGPIRVLEAERTPARVAQEKPPTSIPGVAERATARVPWIPIAMPASGALPRPGRPAGPISVPPMPAGASARPQQGPETPAPMPERGVLAVPPAPPGGTGELLRPVPGGARPPVAPSSTGTTTTVLIPGKTDRYAVVYEVRELPDVFASHNPFTFQREPPEFYWHRNPRDYDNPANQERIVSDSSPGKFQPERLITDNPDAVNGPPIIDEAGNVLGGNSRVMKLTRAYSGQPGMDAAGAAAYKALLMQNAARFGLDPGIISGMETPILVRRLVKPLRADEAAKAVIDLNLDPQAEMTPAERAVADARRTPIEAVEYLQRAVEEAGPEATLNDALSGPKGARIINELVSQGVFTAQEKPSLVDAKTGALTGAAKDRISKLMLGRLFRDADQVERTPAEIKAKLERIVAPVARLQGQPEWDVMPRVQEAIDLLEYARATGVKNLDDVTRQGAMFGTPEWTPQAIAIAKKLGEKPTEVVRAFRQYAGEAEMAAQGAMMFGTPTPEASFAAAFGPRTEALPPVPGKAGPQGEQPGLMFGSSTKRYRRGESRVRGKRLPNPR